LYEDDATNGEFLSGADTRSRTRDLLITSQLLYQLSYIGMIVRERYYKTVLTFRPRILPAPPNVGKQFFSEKLPKLQTDGHLTSETATRGATACG
jgi:hypothetical protein